MSAASSPALTPEPEDEGAVGPPDFDPMEWEDFAVFRETFLSYFTLPEHAAALRVVGKLLFDMTLAASDKWPEQPEGWLRGELRAVVADLRHLEGFLVTLAVSPSPDPYEGALHRMAVLMSRKLASVAEHIEGRLGTWRGEVP